MREIRNLIVVIIVTVALYFLVLSAWNMSTKQECVVSPKSTTVTIPVNNGVEVITTHPIICNGGKK